MILAYSNNGLTCAAQPDGYVAQTGETLFEGTPTLAELEAAFPGYTAAAASQAAASDRAPILAELAALEPLMPRSVEELIELLINKNVIAETDLSSEAQTRLSRKQALRTQMAAVR